MIKNADELNQIITEIANKSPSTTDEFFDIPDDEMNELALLCNECIIPFKIYLNILECNLERLQQGTSIDLKLNIEEGRHMLQCIEMIIACSSDTI